MRPAMSLRGPEQPCPLSGPRSGRCRPPCHRTPGFDGPTPAPPILTTTTPSSVVLLPPTGTPEVRYLAQPPSPCLPVFALISPPSGRLANGVSALTFRVAAASLLPFARAASASPPASALRRPPIPGSLSAAARPS
ncbi:vegetative cell wall protein gp1-like [Nylanderia fulva]|uniref:vegetative cell wall protein gp1-like n=1 Tax=Nylanderia fulva TaxID=613905 RepID=UPI0010FB7E6D|nr:vegetative cell wall protein gp1-like [Nylanderia fulva]XP_029171911.1 vegetative cell wall protein gp1-like [Nylanderia fulva]XP_029177927.1 vegetative cell wall protein gp1-like [Nylanderia fulva]